MVIHSMLETRCDYTGADQTAPDKQGFKCITGTEECQTNKMANESKWLQMISSEDRNVHCKKATCSEKKPNAQMI